MPQVRKFLPHQQKFLESVRPEVIESGAFGSGKTYSLCNKILLLSIRYPRNRGYLCRKTLASLKMTTLKTLLDGDGGLPPVIPPELIKYQNKQDRVIRLTNNSEIYYGQMDMEFIKSLNLGWAAVDETSEITEDEWNALKGRLRLAGVPVRQLIGATNPDSDQHWIYNRMIVNPAFNRKGEPLSEFIQSSTLDNIYLPPEYIEGLERTYFGHYYERYVLGKWVGAGRIVFDNFNRKIHLHSNFDVPKHWKRYRSFDFGYRSPFSCLWIAECGYDVNQYSDVLQPGDFIVYREIYYTERTTLINAGRVKELSVYADGEPEIFVANYADWDAGDRAELESVGIRTIKANKDIGLGIQRLRELLGNVDPTRGMITRPRFYIMAETLAEYDPKIRINLETGGKNNNPTCLAEELLAFSWKLSRASDQVKEEPEDRYNHAVDSARYFACTFQNQQWKHIDFLTLNPQYGERVAA
jgi:phage terminase large subunit